jgi:hypothetical protein
MKNITLIFFMCLGNFAFSQCFVGINAGTSHYFGDLAKASSPFASGNTKAVVGLEYGKSVSTNWNVVFGFNVGSLAADDLSSADAGHVNRGFEFKSTVIEFQFLMDYKVLNLEMNGGSKLQLGISSGLSMVYFDPKHTDDFVANLVQDNESYAPFSLAIPVNLYLGLSANDVVYFTQVETRKTFTDHLDGFSNLVNSESKDSFGFFKIGARIPIRNLTGNDCL